MFTNFFSFHRIVFWMVFGILIGTGLFYLIFADGKVQAWNVPKALKRQEEDDEDSIEIENSREAKENFVKNI